jgi:hypothetical protein
MLTLMAEHPSPIRELARRGAEVRLQDLAQEVRLLLRLFPRLQDASDRDGLPVSFIVAMGSGS